MALPLRVRDQLGQDISFSRSGGGGYPDDTQDLLEAYIPSGTKKISFTFAVQRARYVELTAPRTLLQR